MPLSRRSFLWGFAVAAAGCASKQPAVSAPQDQVYDFHVHLFGVGDGGTGCHLSAQQRRHWNYPFFLKLLNLSENGRMDQQYVAELVSQLRASSIRKCVLLAQDARYNSRGQRDLDATNFYVPNEYLFRVVDDFPDLFIACASINPKRPDAMEELALCAERGARVIKIHPPTQDVDPSEDRFRPFYRRMTELGVLLMVHTGAEHASQVSNDRLTDPALLFTALDEGCTVIAAHSGMGSFLDRAPFREDYFQNLVGLIHRFPKLYCDTAVLASMFRWRNLPRILREPIVLDRLIHGSDWPFTSNALVFWSRLSARRLFSLSAEANLFERDLQIKRALGFPTDVFERGAQLLLPTKNIAQAN